MATFYTKKLLYGSPALIPAIAERIQEEFQNEDYEVAVETLSSGAYDISITKGGTFKAVLGLKTALKISLIPQGDKIKFEAGVGIFGKQIVPLVIMYFVGWPLLITQIWGLVEQSRLDDRALDIANSIVHANAASAATVVTSSKLPGKFCPYCGTENSADALFCKVDGKPL